MRHLTPLALIFWLFSLAAHAQFTLPHIDTPAQANEFRAMIADQAPWYMGYGGRGHVDNMVNTIPALTAYLEGNKDWQQLAAQRPARRTITVNLMKEGYENGRTVRPEVAAVWAKEIGEAQGLAGDRTIFEYAQSEVDWVSTHDVRALMTGLINSVPGIDKRKFFRMGSPAEQLVAIQNEADFTDANLKKYFRAQAFGLEEAQVSRANLLAMAQESLEREANLPKILRAAWATHLLKAAELKKLDKVEPMRIDVFGKTADELKPLFEKMKLSAKSQAFVAKQMKNFVKEDDYIVDRIKVMKPADFVTVEEVTPAIGGTRGCFMHDCSLEAWGHAYTPTEYVFVVRDSKGQVQGFMASTRAKSAVGDVLFVHDFGGNGLEESICDFAMRGLFLAKEDMGFAEITFAAHNGNNGEWYQWVNRHAKNGQLKQTYYDTEIRARIEGLIAYPHGYDLGTNANNHQGYKYVPDGIENYSIQVDLTGAGAVMPDELSNSELLLKAIGILTLNPEAGLNAEMRAIGMHPAELNELVRVLANADHRPLAEFYDSLKEFFGKYEINMSRNFIRDHEYLFQPGHLNAADAVTTKDGVLKNQTVRYVVYAFKHAEDLDPLFQIVEENLEYFKGNENFQRYINSFSGHGAREVETLDRLKKMGFNFDYILKDKEASAIFMAGNSPELRLWILESLRPAQLKALPVEIVRLVADDLGADDDFIPMRAMKLLERMNHIDDEKVMKELKRSGKDEEVMELAMRAAVLYYETGGDSDSLAKRVRKYEGSDEWDAALRRRLDAVLAKLPEPKKKSKDEEDCEKRAG